MRESRTTMSSGTNSRSIIFFGNERLVSGLTGTDTPVLKALIAAGYDIKAVVANDAGTKSRKQKVLEVAELAKANNIPVHTPHRPMDIYDELAAYNADAGVLVAYGRIVPQKLIDLFPFGIINIHPSLLPKYRGPSPIESAIANGDVSTGVSIMALSAKMDAGPVYHQVEYHLPQYETAPDLSQKLASLAATELIAALPNIFNRTLLATEQDESGSTYCQLITKQDARLSPHTQTAEQAERLVRAYKAFPRARLTVAGHDLILVTAHIAEQSNGPLDVEFSGGTFLCIDELVAPSGKTMSAEAFAKGYLNI
ncbi:methionyl-tRNA formyltransferase [Candidatus Saccharibacteria bacterium]|nr:methionyl-tRNA formyltransferase [Candidatus Saccharibacteria bacterium]